MTMLTVRTRLKVCMIAFFVVVVTAWAKNWFPGISLELMGMAVTTVLGYLFVETKRPSNGET